MATNVVQGGVHYGKQGFGCMGITAFYNTALSDDEAVALLKGVHEAGCTHFDTAELYRHPMGPPTPETKYNECQLGNFLKTIDRSKVTVATKMIPSQLWGGQTDAATVEKAVDASLERLGTDYIDLYYLHRLPPHGAVQFVESCKPLIAKGKIKAVGISEASAANIRAAHAVHPLHAVQMEWSLLTRNIEPEIVPVCKELGITIVAYSPLCRNLLTGIVPEGGAFQSMCPRWQGENLEKNKQLVAKVEAMAKEKKVSTATLSLAWLQTKAAGLGVQVLPIPGTTKLAHFKENYSSTNVVMSPEEMQALEAIADAVAGPRGPDWYISSSFEAQK